MKNIKLNGNNIQLMPINKSNITYLYNWSIDINKSMLWNNRRDIPSYEQYIEEFEWRIRNNTLTQLLINKVNEDIPIGTIYAYDSHLTDGYTFITIYLDPSYTNMGYGAEATLLFIDYLFAYLPLRKIYTEVYSYNSRSLQLMRIAGLQEEGCFRQHRWFNGNYADLYRFALYSHDWPKIREIYLSSSQKAI